MENIRALDQEEAGRVLIFHEHFKGYDVLIFMLDGEIVFRNELSTILSLVFVISVLESTRNTLSQFQNHLSRECNAEPDRFNLHISTSLKTVSDE